MDSRPSKVAPFLFRSITLFVDQGFRTTDQNCGAAFGTLPPSSLNRIELVATRARIEKKEMHMSLDRLSRRKFLAGSAGASLIALHPFSVRAAANQAHLRIMETTDLHVHV